LTQSGVDESQRFERTMIELGLVASMECVAALQPTGVEVHHARTTYMASSLRDHPVYHHVFEGLVARACTALAATQVVSGRAQAVFDEPPDMRTAVVMASHLLEELLASPGLSSSRKLLLAGGFAPPCVRGSDGTTRSLALHYHRAADPQRLRGAEQAVHAAAQAITDDEADRLLELCLATEARWASFQRAAQRPRYTGAQDASA
jgi:hypothetical protein